jgi:hypothetical protein
MGVHKPTTLGTRATKGAVESWEGLRMKRARIRGEIRTLLGGRNRKTGRFWIAGERRGGRAGAAHLRKSCLEVQLWGHTQPRALAGHHHHRWIAARDRARPGQDRGKAGERGGGCLGCLLALSCAVSQVAPAGWVLEGRFHWNRSPSMTSF